MNDNSVDAEVVSRFAELCAEGQVTTVEEYCTGLSTHPGKESPSKAAMDDLSAPTIIALLQTEIAARRGRGEQVEFTEIRARFPELDEDILRDLVELPIFAPPADREQDAMLPSRYQLLSKLGSGGVGEVWKAYDSLMEREVAVKTIRKEHRLNQVVNQRLEREALITGAIQHPGIPSIHGFGRLADGSVHVVMKQVQGTTLAEILAQGQSESEDLPRLINIFAQIAKTLAFTHAQGVIHRDLKPQNIMVGRFGEVQVLDWGMSKRTEQESETETTTAGGDTLSPADESEGASVLTRAGEVFGTPAYMAPEQASGSQQQVGPQSDVFSLGAMLYEILCGRRLHPSADGQDLIQRAAAGVTPESLEELRTSGIDEKLRNICERCLQLSPKARPANAGDVSDAVVDYLEGTQVALEQERLDRQAAEIEAVEATKRRKATVWFLSAIVAASLIGIVGVLWQWSVASEARDEAQTQGNLAEERFLQAKQTVDQFLVEVANSGSLLSATPGTQALRRTLLTKAKNYYEAFTATEPDSLELKAELANAYQSLGKVARELESGDETIEVLSKALQIREDVIAEGFQIPEQTLELMRTHNELATAYDSTGDADATIRSCKQVQLLAKDAALASELDADLELAKALNTWGTALSRKGLDQDAETKQREAVKLLRELHAAHRENPAIQLVLVESLRRLAVTETLDNRRAAARATLEEALSILDREDMDTDSAILVAYGTVSISLGQVYWDDGDAEKAIELNKTACDRLEQIVMENPLVADPIRVLGNNYNYLGYFLTATSDNEALEVFNRSIPLLERAVANRPQDLGMMKELAECYALRGEYFLQQRESAKALADVERALGLNTERLALAPDNRDIVDLLIQGRKSQGILLRRTGRPEDSAQAYLAGIALIEQLEKEGRASRETLRSKAGISNNLAYLYQSEGEFEKSLQPYEQAAELYEELAEGDIVRIEYYYHASSLTNKAAALNQLGRSQESKENFDQAIDMLESAQEKRPDNRMLMQFLFESYVYRSDLFDRLQNYTGAQQDLEAALELEEDVFFDMAKLKLLAVNVALGKVDESVKAAEKLLEDKPSDFWAEAARIAARAATLTQQREDLSEEERTERVGQYATLAANKIEHAMEMNRFMFLNSDVIPTIPEHKQLWERPEYEKVRSYFEQE